MGSLMKSLFGGQPSPQPIALPPPPAPPEPLKEVRNRAGRGQDDLRRRASMMGAKATNPTGSLGLPGAAPTAKKSLLGQ